MGHSGEVRRTCPDVDGSGGKSEEDGRVEKGITEDQRRRM